MRIVFVHLNGNVPRYLGANLERHINLFRNHSVILIQDEKSRPFKLPKLLNYTVAYDNRWEELNHLYSHPKDFRRNFWLTSSTRLYALHSFMKTSEEEMLHLESDVIIAPDFPFKKFQLMSETLAFPVMSNERGVGSVIYIRDLIGAEILTSNLIAQARVNPQSTEMLALRKIMDDFPENVKVLPVGPNQIDIYRNASRSMTAKLVGSANYFGGIIDGVEIGQYFFGTDPRNRRSRILMRQDIANGYCNIAKCNLKFDTYRKFPNLRFSTGGEIREFPIFALHVPSKEVKIFRLNRQIKVFRRRCRESNRGSRHRWSIGVFFRAIWESVGRRYQKFKDMSGRFES
jgi:hypothetical protein